MEISVDRPLALRYIEVQLYVIVAATKEKMAAKATTTTQNNSLIEPSRAAVKSNLIDQDSISFLWHGFPNFWNRKFKRSVLEWCPSYRHISLFMLYLWLLTGMFININFQIFYIIFLFYFQVLTNKYIVISISGSSVILMILSFKMNAFLQELILSWVIAVPAITGRGGVL